ncbi:Alpha-galactosidase [Glycine max]|nr:Alpha-galactosidase [Glycine max]
MQALHLIHGCLILLISIFLRFLRFLFGSGCMWPSGISGSIAYNWSWLNMKTGVKIIHASSPPPHSRVFDFVNFDLFVIFAIFIWIGVSVTQWYFGFNRLQLGIYSDAGNQTCSKRMPRSLGHEEKMQKHFLLGYI